jgi:hypothetical protein
MENPWEIWTHETEGGFSDWTDTWLCWLVPGLEA